MNMNMAKKETFTNYKAQNGRENSGRQVRLEMYEMGQDKNNKQIKIIIKSKVVRFLAGRHKQREKEA